MSAFSIFVILFPVPSALNVLLVRVSVVALPMRVSQALGKTRVLAVVNVDWTVPVTPVVPVMSKAIRLVLSVVSTM